MGASWLEIESLLKQLDDVTAFPHAEALLPVTRARDTVAAAAMIVSRAGVTGDPRTEIEAQDAMARARVTLHEAQVAVRRAREAVVLSQSGCERAEQLIREARAMRARDGGRPSSPATTVHAPGGATAASERATALVLRRA